MEELLNEVVEMKPIEEDAKHDFAMMLVGALAGWLASRAAHRAYTIAIETYRQRNIIDSDEE